MTVAVASPRSWRARGVFSPRRKLRTPRTPLDTVDSLDRHKFDQITNAVATPRPGRRVCDHCGVEAATARLHCVHAGTASRLEDERCDYHVSLCHKCMKKEDRGELDSQVRTARHSVDKRVKKVERMKAKMRKFWTNMVGLFATTEDEEGATEEDLNDLKELDKNLSASFNSWLMRRSLRKSKAKPPATATTISLGAQDASPKTDRDAEDSPQQYTWRRHWAFIGTKRSEDKISRSSSDSDSSFLDFLRPSCFGATPREDEV